MHNTKDPTGTKCHTFDSVDVELHVRKGGMKAAIWLATTTLNPLSPTYGAYYWDTK